MYTSTKRLLQVDFISIDSTVIVFLKSAVRGNFIIIGSIIFKSNKTDSTKQDWTWSTNTRVELTFMNQAYQVILLTAVDLDVASVRSKQALLIVKSFLWFILIHVFAVQLQCIQLLLVVQWELRFWVRTICNNLDVF